MKKNKKEVEPLVYYITFSSNKNDEDEQIEVENVVVHPNYEKNERSIKENYQFYQWTHDFALLKLKKHSIETASTTFEEVDVTEDDDLETIYEDEGYWMYDSVEKNRVEKAEREVACMRNSYRKGEESSDLFFFKESDGSNCMLIGHQQE